MIEKKLKLINDERKRMLVLSAKACTTYDFCTKVDNSSCNTYDSCIYVRNAANRNHLRGALEPLAREIRAI